MNAKKIAIAAVAAIGLMSANAQVLTPETGVANDHGQQPELRDVHVVYEARSAQNGYGYEDGMTVVGFTFLPWAAPNSSWDVHGVRLNFGWGRHREMVGLDTGFFGASDYFGGLSATIIGNYTTGNADGVQLGIVNVVDARVRGIQFGLVNYAGDLKGLQLGLLNFNTTGIFFPVVNLGF